MQKIETVITRDNSLIDVTAWHQGYGVGLKEWLGWSYTDSVFYIHDGYTEVMRPPHEHLVEFRDVVLAKIDSDRNWLTQEAVKFDALVKEIYTFYDQATNEINNGADNTAIATIYNKYVALIRKAMGPFITMYWVPAWTEKDEALKQKYQNEIALALDYRKKTEHLFPGGAVLTDLILSKVQNQTGIEASLARVLSGQELIDYLLNNSAFDVENLRKRYKGFVYSRKGIMLTDGSNEDLTRIMAEIGYEFVPKIKVDVKEIKGQIACPGKAQGKARLIMSKKDIPLLQDGEILITAMTTPEYLPAMKKSAAFVTDEGGITCHAAIVARELKTPCIIGTKNATQVFKDGDMIEVDADKGIVKKLN